MKHVQEPPEPMPEDLPAPIRELIDITLTKDPAGRYANGGEFADAVAAVRAGHRPPPPGRVPTAASRMVPPVAAPAATAMMSTQRNAASTATTVVTLPTTTVGAVLEQRPEGGRVGRRWPARPGGDRRPGTVAVRRRIGRSVDAARGDDDVQDPGDDHSDDSAADDDHDGAADDHHHDDGAADHDDHHDRAADDHDDHPAADDDDHDHPADHDHNHGRDHDHHGHARTAMTTPRNLSSRYELGEILGFGGMSEVHLVGTYG